MNWRRLAIGEFCQTGSGGTPKRSNRAEYYGGSIPWVKSGELVDEQLRSTEEFLTEKGLKESSAKLVPPGAVLIAMYGATVGRTALLEIEAATNQAICFLIPDKRLATSRYVWYALRASFTELLSKRVGGAQPNISQQIIKATQLSLPTLTEQSRIVELLDDADRLRRLRREADAKAARILPALFLKMFGDPATNPIGWEEKPVSMVIQSVEAGWSARGEGRPREADESGVLKVSAVTSGIFQPEENKAVLNIDPSRNLVTPVRGDLLFSRANTRALVAATCIVEEDHPDLFLPDKLWKITPFIGKASNLFLKELFWHDSIRDKFRAVASGSSGSMLNISQEAMLRTTAPIPPFSKQRDFEEKAWAVMEITRSASHASNRIDDVWTSLLQNAFSGDLTAKWRMAHMKELLEEMEHQARALNQPLTKELEALS